MNREEYTQLQVITKDIDQKIKRLEELENSINVNIREFNECIENQGYRFDNLSNSLDNCKIPEEIKYIKENKFTLNDISAKYLIIYTVISLIINALCIWGIFYYKNEKDIIKKDAKENYIQGLKDYNQFLMKSDNLNKTEKEKITKIYNKLNFKH